ncbi:MAG: YciI family protein [Verrucomicrobiota bacterium]
MQYALLIYQSPRWATLSSDAKNAVHVACGAWHEELVRAGQSRTCAGLQPITTATTFRGQDGQVTISDGPFAETKEVLGGLEIVECKDLDEAMAIARRFPALDAGCVVEVRPLVPGNNCRD